MKVKIYQCRSEGVIAKLIRIIQKTNYNHYALSYESITGEEIFCDSTAHGVRQMTSQMFRKKYRIKKMFLCEKEIPTEWFLSWFEKHLGKSYGFRQILGLFLKLFRIVKNNPFGAGKKRIICNELVVMFLNNFYAANVVDTDSLDLNDTEKLLLEVL